MKLALTHGFGVRRLLVLIGISVLNCSCAPVDVSSEIAKVDGSVALVGSIVSKMTGKEAAEKLAENFGSDAIVEAIPVAIGSQRQLINESSITIQKARIGGFTGKVRLDFFWDRLARIVFYPDDTRKFVVATFGTGDISTNDLKSQIRYRVITIQSTHVIWSDNRIMAIVEKAISRSA